MLLTTTSTLQDRHIDDYKGSYPARRSWARTPSGTCSPASATFQADARP